jgi:hypothetical protein
VFAITSTGKSLTQEQTKDFIKFLSLVVIRKCARRGYPVPHTDLTSISGLFDHFCASCSRSIQTRGDGETLWSVYIC